ncbi:MAG TPA: cell surface protein [Tenacibaculum sp.]|nr:cell surface protein [Tenacibaculum sp.]
MRISKFLIGCFLGSTIFISCSDEVINNENDVRGDYENGIIISGEGSSSVSGSISFISNDYATVDNNIYKNVNDQELGEYVQSVSFDEKRAYIITDNQNTISIVNRYTFEKEGTLTVGLNKPRYMTIVGNKGYVTNWGASDNNDDDFVAIVNLSTMQVEDTINVTLGPERIIYHNNKLFVSNKGAFGVNNKVVVINLANNQVEKEIIVKDKPDELFIDNAGNLVVLSEGATIYDSNWNVLGHTLGAISFIDTIDGSIEKELVFSEGQHPSQMVVQGNDIYYSLGNDIFKLNSNSTTLPTSKLLSVEAGYLYGMEIRDDELFILDTNFQEKSLLKIYDLATNNKKEEKKVALGGSKIYFN